MLVRVRQVESQVTGRLSAGLQHGLALRTDAEAERPGISPQIPAQQRSQDSMRSDELGSPVSGYDPLRSGPFIG